MKEAILKQIIGHINFCFIIQFLLTLKKSIDIEPILRKPNLIYNFWEYELSILQGLFILKLKNLNPWRINNILKSRNRPEHL